ncbi:MAG: MBL fold metallo-hydrolase [Lacisediminihabitans sp.]
MSVGSITRVSVLSTGEVRVRPDNIAATWRPMPLWTLTATAWSAALPINVYVVEHSDGVVLFDTGQDIASMTDPGYYPGGLMGFLYARQARFTVTPEQNLTAQLRHLGIGVEDVRFAVVSHLHQDHIGGLGQLTADVLVSAAELALLEEKNPQLHGVMPEHVRLPNVRFTPIAFTPTDDPHLAPFTESYDIYGDGTLVLLPTPGHTPGSMSLLVRKAGAASLLLVGDVTYDAKLLARGIVPGTGAKALQRETTAKINALRVSQPGLVVLSAHDPHAAELLAHPAVT